MNIYVVKVEAQIPSNVLQEKISLLIKQNKVKQAAELEKKPFANFYGPVYAKTPYDALQLVIDSKMGYHGEFLSYFHRIHVDLMKDCLVPIDSGEK